LLNNEQPSYFEPILLRSLPFDAQVGVLAHELGHIVYYEHLNTLQFGKWGINYLRNDDFRPVTNDPPTLCPYIMAREPDLPVRVLRPERSHL
jgi:hypothetical protein